MPTDVQQDELRNECDWEWTSVNGINGYKVKSRVNDNFIFLPAAGCMGGADSYDMDLSGNYWSNSLDPTCSYNALGFGFSSGRVWDGGANRFRGQSIRPVCPGTK